MIDEIAAPEESSETGPAPLPARIRRICEIVRYAGVIWLFWGVALNVWIWSHPAEFIDKTLRAQGLDPSLVDPIGYHAAFLVTLADHGVVALLVYRLWRLMQGYIDGDIFTVAAAGRLRAVALAGLVATATDIAARLASLALISMQWFAVLPWWRMLLPNDLLYALICGFLLALAVIFRSAAEIAAENRQFI